MKSWSQTYPLPAGRGVIVLQQAGPVQITGVAGTEVKLTATTERDIDLAEHLEVRQDGGRLVVEVKRHGWFFSTTNIGLALEVPSGTACQVESQAGTVEITDTGAEVQIETGSGGVKVTGAAGTQIETGSGPVMGRQIRGHFTAETGSGSVEVRAVQGAVNVEVGSGDVVIRQVQGDLHVETGSGPLFVEEVEGSVTLETGSGGVTARRIRGGSLGVDTGGGPLQLKELDVAQLTVDASSGGCEVELYQVYPGGHYTINTGSGGLLVAIPKEADLHLHVEASSGRVHREGLELRVNHESAGELDAVMGQGRAGLHIEAGSGGIRLVPSKPPLSPVGARVVEAVKGDSAVESSDQLRRIVTMVEEGKLTPQEAEELLRALDEEEPA